MIGQNLGVVAINVGNYDLPGDDFYDLDTRLFRCLITDNTSAKQPSGWHVVKVCNPDGIHPIKFQRKIKLNLHSYFPDLDHCLYIDNTVRLKVSPEEIFESVAHSSATFFLHSWNHTIRSEFDAVSRGQILDFPSRLIRQLEAMSDVDSRCLERRTLWTGMFLRALQNEAINDLFERWSDFVSEHSHRDQLSASMFLLDNPLVSLLPWDNNDSLIHSWPHMFNAHRANRVAFDEGSDNFRETLGETEWRNLQSLRHKLEE